MHPIEFQTKGKEKRINMRKIYEKENNFINTGKVRVYFIFIFCISYILGGSPFSNKADFQGALHLTTNNKFHKQLKVKDTT